MTSPDPTPLLTSLRTRGYVIIPSLLSPTELSALRAAATNITTIARSGNWPHVRTVGKQFPPPGTPPSSPTKPASGGFSTSSTRRCR